MKSCVIIPARLKSSRFYGKPLAHILGRPMILWVAELSAKAVGIDHVYVATDDISIADVVRKSGYKSLMTSEACLTGTDRVAEAAERLDYDLFINVQGDEPIANYRDIEECIRVKSENISSIVNGFCYVANTEDPHDACIPKVVCSRSNRLLYISRSLIPGSKTNQIEPGLYRKQVCIYGFSKQDLFDFRNHVNKTELEAQEDIEILRFLEADKPVLMFECHPGSIAVDRPEDIQKVESIINSNPGNV